mmetsp:Transcript_12603/g.28558  ORF Transcript_12603/g.28558 Transcript_12603/m.28558 type:complete len:581 (-) Transcript_12603:83-1825(-)
MFKKQFAVQSQNLLSKKDLKNLRSQLLEQLPALEEKVVEELLPGDQVKVSKLDNRCLLYSQGDGPATFFDLEGRGELFPTLHTLWMHPQILPELTIYAPVSKFVLNGADLMLPGVIVPANGVAGFGGVSKGQKRCIKIEGNPYPIAVGKMLVNQTQMEKLKGKGLEVCHVFKDLLWALAGKPIPNAGFTEKEDEITPCEDLGYSANGSIAASSTAVLEQAAPEGAQSTPAAAGEGSATPAASPTAAGGGPSDPAQEWSQDDLLDFCFIQAATSSLCEDKALPVEASELYEKHMKPRRPEGTSLDVKKSSHKQIGKFLNALRKAKGIEVVEKKGVISVTKIDLTSKPLQGLKDKFASASAAASSSAPAESSAGKKREPPPAPVVTTLWKPTHYVEGLFKAMGKSKSDVCPWDKALEVLTSYIEKEGLKAADGTVVKLNEELLTALYKETGGQKKDAVFPVEAELEELEDKLLERMHEHTSIEVSGAGSTLRKGPLQKLEVSLSRKGAHNVTRICNLEAYSIDVVSVGDELKKKLNCTVYIEDMPGKNSKDKMMQLQGHVAQEFADFVLDRYGITKSFLSVK